ncbi:GerAB/ArcD/ProY family transporter [Radiobacillus sp. PE A8.2]|uniref:GerAB/ArcD/ProY family transporter n=1 Tax=Radiobacillus sp. PE A8.2 TaxID=3380349 RepID=UPI00388D7146
MKAMQRQVNEEYKISSFLVLYLVCSMQIGIGILSFQRAVVEKAGNDALFAVFIAGGIVHILLLMIFKILQNGQGDLITIHYDIFGKYIGALFSLIWIVYFWSISLVVIRSYIEVVQVWMFPEMNVFFFCLILFCLVTYIITGGFRIVTGICFLGILIPSYLVLTFIFPLGHTDFRNLLPMWNHSYKEMILGTKEMFLSFLGVGTILMYYPFIKNPEKTQKWAHLGSFISTIVYGILLLLSLAYFSVEHLTKNIYPTLTMWKMVEFSFVERFEYIGISSWILIILTNICLALWCASRGIRQLFGLNQRITLLIMLLFLLIFNLLVEDKQQIATIRNIVAWMGLSLLVAYVPLLFALSFILPWKRGRKH